MICVKVSRSRKEKQNIEFVCGKKRIKLEYSNLDDLVNINNKVELSNITFDQEDIDKLQDTINIVSKCLCVCASNIKKKNGDKTFTDTITERIRQLDEAGKYSTKKNYENALKILKLFIGNYDITLQEFTKEIAEKLELFMKDKNLCANTISLHMRVLRAVYNYAYEVGYINNDKSPFKKIFTGTSKTNKRALDVKLVRQLIKLDLSDTKSQSMARDIFIFSIFTRGMSFVDIANLTQSNIINNSIIYNRHKTGQTIKIGICNEIKDIINRYQESSSEGYIFPILKSKKHHNNMSYFSAIRMYNKNLSLIAQKMSPNVRLSSYVARHTWAMIAKNNGVATSIISDAMGHTSEKTTRIYLDSLDINIIDGINSKLIKIIIGNNKNSCFEKK